MAGIGRAGSLSLLAAALGLVPEVTPPAHAQTTPTQQSAADTPAARPGIRVAPVILAEPDVETAISISVGPEQAIPRQTFLRVRGMPLAAKLSEGHVVTPGIWAVPLAALPSLRLLAPLSSSGRTELLLSLVSADGSVLAENKSSLVVAPAWLLGSTAPRQDGPRTVPAIRTELAPATIAAPVAPPTTTTKPEPAAQPEPPRSEPARTVAPTPQPVARPDAPAVVAALPPAPTPLPAPPAAAPPPAPPAAKVEPPRAPAPTATPPAATPPAPKAPAVLSGADRERADGMLQRGETFMRQGNLAAARQFFRRAADMGLPAGALRMGATYDPAELSGQGMVGVQPDPKEAALWYERARELGAPEAAMRLSRLQGK